MPADLLSSRSVLAMRRLRPVFLDDSRAAGRMATLTQVSASTLTKY